MNRDTYGIYKEPPTVGQKNLRYHNECLVVGLRRKEGEMLNNIIKLVGTAMIIGELVNRVLHARSDREKAIQRNKAGMLALGVSIGCTVGAVAGVLFAPRAGKDTREDVGRRGSEAWEKIKDNVSASGHRLVQAIEEKGACLCTVGGKCDDAAKEPLQELSAKLEKMEPKKN